VGEGGERGRALTLQDIFHAGIIGRYPSASATGEAAFKQFTRKGVRVDTMPLY